MILELYVTKGMYELGVLGGGGLRMMLLSRFYPHIRFLLQVLKLKAFRRALWVEGLPMLLEYLLYDPQLIVAVPATHFAEGIKPNN